MQGFPVWQLGVICVMRFSEPLAFTSLFPYVYFMIRDFGIAESEAQISKYAGYLSSSFALTQFICTIQWGRVSDKIGRKYVLMTGLMGTSLMMLLFGFSTNYYMALFARSAMGCLNGNIAVLRTAIGEMVTKRSQQAIAFSSLPLLWNVGSVVGPLVGGSSFFTRPKHSSKYDELSSLSFGEWHDKFLDKYPYALSNIFVAVFLWIGLITGFLFLEETHPAYKNRRDIGLEIGDGIRRFLGFKTPPRPWQIKPDVEQESSPLLDGTSVNDEGSSDSEFDHSLPPQQLYSATNESEVVDDNSSINSEEYVALSRRTSNAVIRRYSSKSTIRPVLSRTISGISGIRDDGGTEGTSLSDIFTPGVVQTMTSSFILAFHSIVYSEFLPIFLAKKLMVDKLEFPFRIAGGFGFDSDFIGTMMSTTGMSGIFTILVVFPILDRRFRPTSTYKVASFVFPIIHIMVPFYIFTLHEYNSRFSPGFTKKLLYGNAICYQMANALSFPQLVLLVHRAAVPKHRAFTNGAALSLNSLARFVAPLVWGGLMTFFDQKERGGFPWYILAIISFSSVVQALFMKDYDNDLKSGSE